MAIQVVFFTNSGTEANELALMIARLYTGCQDIVSLRNGYHGNAAGTMAATAQSNYKFNVVQVYIFVRQLLQSNSLVNVKNPVVNLATEPLAFCCLV